MIVDAAFLRRTERDQFRALAGELRVPFTILHCSADDARLRERVAARSAAASDASEADLHVLERQQQYNECLADDERAFTIDLATDQAVDIAALCERWMVGQDNMTTPV